MTACFDGWVNEVRAKGQERQEGQEEDDGEDSTDPTPDSVVVSQARIAIRAPECEP